MPSHNFIGWAQTWHDDIDTTQRLTAIRKFGKIMINPVAWKQGWEEGGGTSGILHLLSLASVSEVKVFADVIRASNRRGKKSSEREKAVEELVMALLPQHYPSTELRTRDRRPLQKFYGRMLRGCSSSFVEAVLDAKNTSNPLFQQLNLTKMLFAHDDLLKRRLANYLIHEGPPLSEPEMSTCFREFVFREPPLPGTQPKMSASMQFAHELLQARVNLPSAAQRWPRNVSELEVLVSVYRRLSKKSRSADKTFLIELGLRLIELKLDFKGTAEAGVLWTAIVALWKKNPRQYEGLLSRGMRLELRGSEAILSILATRWRDDPDQYEPLLIQALSRGLGGPKDGISKGYLKTVSNIPHPELGSELRWRLLRLYCQHVPQNGIDIATASNFQCLANQEWSFDVVDKLEREHAVLFLSHLYSVNPNFDFLLPPLGYKSIFAMRNGPRRNFNVELLLTTYQQDNSDTQKRAQDELDRLRKKAATSREWEDRATFAKAAAHYAIATGSLDAYAETLLWQQRFIRDPLTVRPMFAPEAICTREGVALLSGMPESPSEDTTLSTIKQRLTVANQMLEGYNGAKRTAMKEPSYDESCWYGLEPLYGEVYQERVSRAQKLKRQPDESELDLFNVIWEGTAAFVDSIGHDFLFQVSRHILCLLDRVSGPSLIAACETLLDFAAEWGKKEDRNRDQDDMTATMEKMAYQAVAKLAYSNTPTLAQSLIRRTIIEHPKASSWHRQFLSIKYMRDLPAEAAKTMLLSFAAAIGEKLEEQSYVRVGDEEPAKSAPPQSLVKVTTVKYLAQLLNDADFISPESAVDVLIEIFKSATHIDIRLATLDSLLGTLNAILGEGGGDTGKSNPMVQKILDTLNSVVSIAGNVNERRPVSDMDWAEAAEKVTVPAISEETTIPALFGAILKATTGDQFPNLRKLQGELFSRLVLPTLHQSQEQHRKWLSLFLAKYKPALNADILPRVPISPRIWPYMLSQLGHILPSATIDEYNKHVILRLKMPKEIQEFNKELQSDPLLRNDANVCHWLSIFDKSGSWHTHIHSLLNLIIIPAEKAAPTADLMDIVVSQASVLLDDYENHMEKWSHLVTSLGPTRTVLPHSGNKDYNKDMEARWTRWRETTPVLAQKLVALIEKKTASRATLSNAGLPSTFPLRLWCLPYSDPHTIPQDEDFRHLAGALDRSLSSFLQSDEGDVLLWTTFVENIHTTLASVYTTMPSRMHLAIHIGDLSVGPDSTMAAAAQLIKVAVALKFVDSVSGNGALGKPTSEKDLKPKKLREGELIRRLHAVMDNWGRRNASDGQPPFRHMVLQWKNSHKAAWADIGSW